MSIIAGLYPKIILKFTMLLSLSSTLVCYIIVGRKLNCSAYYITEPKFPSQGAPFLSSPSVLRTSVEVGLLSASSRNIQRAFDKPEVSLSFAHRIGF